MKTVIYFLFALALVYGCASTQNDKPMTQTDPTVTDNDTVRIANDSLEYEILIIEPGYNTFLNSIARPEGFYSQNYLENKNRFLVPEYNQRVSQPFQYNNNLYPQQIDYNSSVDYGYEVNYKLYYYFVYFSRKYQQRFSVPTRI
ncbi:DUF6146 family protein [Leeuwenhoekiella marinoflava]|uniref:Lipoprotein n=2 Tax=Leeuwenhoekiella marinoflava TaxID=988 RepID=A0A4Q0PQD5_9FLAO|nr:DUF6146 family protein [Leeuwenhoekiella marinoflava]RXG32714.1 hypothetical protein DSL99_490 [Leeuwenhoekiella marinoflava]SHE54424.1 hypothetical protein SAMN02745246_00549 [Leeuwenhoekiella marinoflava DSM 3653]